MVNTTIGPVLIGRDPVDQVGIDNLMVGLLEEEEQVSITSMGEQLLAKSISFVVSRAVCKAGAHAQNIPVYQHIANIAGNKTLVIPVPAFRFVNELSHAGNHILFQEFMIVPVGASSFDEALEMGTRVRDSLKGEVSKRYGEDPRNVGYEGFFPPDVQEDKKILELLSTAIEKAGYNGRVFIGIRVAGSRFYNRKNQTYDLNFKEKIPWWEEAKHQFIRLMFCKKGQPHRFDGSQEKSGTELIESLKRFVANYPIAFIEDPFDKEDWTGYTQLTGQVGGIAQIIRSDLLQANSQCIEKAIKKKSCNAFSLELNRIGSVSECIEAVKMSKRAGWGVITSDCSGETDDPFTLDLTVGLATGQIKAGMPSISGQIAKYNQLLLIERQLGSAAVYAGASFRQPVQPY